MGTSRSAPAFAAKLERAAKAVGDTRPATTKAAQATKAIFIAEAARDGVGATGRSKVAKGVRVNYQVVSGPSGTVATVRYTGPAHLINNPTEPHMVRPKKSKGRGRKAGALSLPGIGVRMSAQHPGTKGKHFFQRARAKAKKTAPEVYRREGLERPLREVFK